jgi:gluconokinase
VDPRGRLWTYALDENWWVTGGIVSSGAIVYDWFLRALGPEAANPDRLHAEVNGLAAAVPAGAEGLIFLPYLSGEQCPVWDPETTGGFLGLTLRHTRGHLARAVLEGITASIARIAETLRERLGAIEEIRVTGGLVGSAAWLRIAADMFEARVLVPESPEGSALGAAVLAWVALGMAPDYGVAREIARTAGTIEPDAGGCRVYRVYLERAARLLAAVKSVRE